MAGDFVRHARTVSLLTLVSRVLGMVRDVTLAAVFGTTMAMNAFSVAFALPNLFRRLFGEGALSVAFIPVFTGLVEQGDERAAQRLANLTITLLVAVLATVVLLGEGGILLAARLIDGPPKLLLTLALAAVMLPFVVTICLVALLQGTLNVRGHFFAPALAPILLNVFIITGAVLSAPLWGQDLERRIYGVALSVLAAGLVQVALQVPALRRYGFRFGVVWDTASPHLRRIARLMLPMVVGLGIVQLNTFVDQLIAMGFSRYADADDRMVTHFQLWGRAVAYPLKQNAVSVMYFGQRLYMLPMGVFTIALGTAIFPALSRHAHHDDRPGAARTLNRGLRVATFIALPCTVGLAVVAMPLVRMLFERGRFTAADTPDVALMSVAYASGLVSFSVLHLVTRAFFAFQAPLTPVKTAVAAAALNFVLNVVLIWPLGIRGLAVSTVIAATAQALVLVWLLRRRIGPLGLRRYLSCLWRCAAATGAMGLAAWQAMRLADLTGWAAGGKAHAAVALAAAVVAGLAVYAAAARLLGMEELGDVLARRRPPAASDDHA